MYKKSVRDYLENLELFLRNNDYNVQLDYKEGNLVCVVFPKDFRIIIGSVNINDDENFEENTIKYVKEILKIENDYSRNFSESDRILSEESSQPNEEGEWPPLYPPSYISDDADPVNQRE
jgi:hypothetical protein